MTGVAEAVVARQPKRHRHWQRMVPGATTEGAARQGGGDLSLPFLHTPMVALIETCKHRKHTNKAAGLLSSSRSILLLLFSSSPSCQ